ncbi:MAG: DUF1566 domain-containing protein [Leptospiraceae bacterium]|nr:DUF1566 domain-containing protein [Leptospiraceae bacterium]
MILGLLMLAAFVGLARSITALLAQDHDSVSVDQRWQPAREGSVRDRHTNHWWTRCSIGQTPRAWLCEQQPRAMSQAEARRACENLQLGAKKWRLPELNELRQLIVILAPGQNALNQQVFAMSTRAEYWSRSPVRSALLPEDQSFYYVNFQRGGVYAAAAADKLFVRCISP